MTAQEGVGVGSRVELHGEVREMNLAASTAIVELDGDGGWVAVAIDALEAESCRLRQLGEMPASRAVLRGALVLLFRSPLEISRVRGCTPEGGLCNVVHSTAGRTRVHYQLVIGTSPVRDWWDAHSTCLLCLDGMAPPGRRAAVLTANETGCSLT